MINNAASQLKDKATVYDILVPTSIAVNLDEEMQEAVGSSNQGDAFDYIYVIWILPSSRFRFWMYSGSTTANTCISRQIITGRQTVLTTPTRS